MAVPLRIAEIVSSPHFLEGNALYRRTKTPLVSSIEPSAHGAVSVRGAVELAERREVSLVVSSEGTLVQSSCSLHGAGPDLCPDIVAVALRYNELVITESPPVAQLADLAEQWQAERREDPIPLFISDEGIVFGGDPAAKTVFGRFFARLGLTERRALVGVAPQWFTFNGVWVRRGELPIEVRYHRERGTLRFSLPDGIIFDAESGLLFDRRQATAMLLGEQESAFLQRLLSFSVPYQDEAAFFSALSRLSDRVKAVFRLSGHLDGRHEEIGDAPVEFSLRVEKNVLLLDIFVTVHGRRITVIPHRADREQVYVDGERLFILAPEMTRRMRQAVRDAGFKVVRGRMNAPLAHLGRLLADDSPLREMGAVSCTRAVRRMTIAEPAADESDVAIELHPEEGWFSFSLRLPESVVPLPVSALIAAMEQVRNGEKTPVVLDEAGNPVILEDSVPFLMRLSARCAYGASLPGERVSTRFLPHLLRGGGKKRVVKWIGDAREQPGYEEICRACSEGRLPDIPDRPSFSALRPYQRDGVRWIRFLAHLGLGGVLADEMGLGKTLQMLSAIVADDTATPSLIVVPKTLVWSWEHEVGKFFPDLSRRVIDAVSPLERTRLWRTAREKVIITSYGVLVNDLAVVRERRFRFLVMDEAQHLKNDAAKRTRAIRMVHAACRMALTGTPIENHLGDLWSIFETILPGLLGRKQEIQRAEREGDSAVFERTAALTAPFVLRREKKDLLPELPPVIVKEYPVEMTPKQKEIYLSHLLRGRAEFLEAGGDMNKMDVLALLTKLRLAANHPMLVSPAVRDLEESGKMLLLRELLEEIRAAGGRTLIFSQFVTMLRLIERMLVESGVSFFYMDGDTQERREPVERFNRGEREVFLLSLKVGGYGLNLTGADHVIIVDPWWNPAAEEQAWSRAHRIGQRREVVVSKLFSRGTVEEKILVLQREKKDLRSFFLKRTLVEPSKDLVRLLAEMEFHPPA